MSDKTYIWSMSDSDHLYPTNDEKRHKMSPDCWCLPTNRNDIFIHNCLGQAKQNQAQTDRQLTQVARNAATDYIREQLVPADDALHAACDRCWCDPTIKDGILVHNRAVPNHEIPNTSPTSQPTSAHAVLQKAAQIVQGDRAKQHGPKERNHQNIADHWNAYLTHRLKTPLTPHDVALMMVELKIARAKGATQMGLETNPDNYVDMAGYAGVAGEIALNGGEKV